MPERPAEEEWSWICISEAETEAVGAELALRLPADGVLLLGGEMGSGKTVLVRGLAVALGVPRAEVQSPTYALMHEYQGPRRQLLHVDLYRLEGHEVECLGLDELLAGPGIKAVEWPDRLTSVPTASWRLEIRRISEGRHLVLTPPAD